MCIDLLALCKRICNNTLVDEDFEEWYEDLETELWFLLQERIEFYDETSIENLYNEGWSPTEAVYRLYEDDDDE